MERKLVQAVPFPASLPWIGHVYLDGRRLHSRIHRAPSPSVRSRRAGIQSELRGVSVRRPPGGFEPPAGRRSLQLASLDGERHRNLVYSQTDEKAKNPGRRPGPKAGGVTRTTLPGSKLHGLPHLASCRVRIGNLFCLRTCKSVKTKKPSSG